MVFYGLKSCDTCRKALKELRNAGVEPWVVDVRAEGVPGDVLARFHAEFGARLINTRSTTWRGLSERERAGEPLDLLTKHPALMKRPAIESDGRRTIGWDARTAAAWIGGRD